MASKKPPPCDTCPCPAWGMECKDVRTHEQQAAEPQPTVRPTAYSVSLLPEDDINAPFYEITVEYRGRGLWAAVRHRQCLAADGEWSWESIPSEREDEWLATHRFPLAEALRLAKEAAPHIGVNGRTAADVFGSQQ